MLQLCSRKRPEMLHQCLNNRHRKHFTHLDTKTQNMFWYLATRKFKLNITTNSHNMPHKKHQHNLNQIKNTLQWNNLTIAKADKGKTMVIIDKNTLKQKIDTFIQENHITCLYIGPTDSYQKQIQQAIQKCDILIDRHINKYLVNIQPTAPKLNALIYKENEPIRPVINNKQAPSYKIYK